MSNKADYKSKYLALRSRYLAAVDTAFRAGFQKGAEEAQKQMAMQQAAMGQGGQAGAEGGAGGGKDEVASHIEELEQAVAKSESGPAIPPRAAALLGHEAKAALTLQHKIVSDIMKKWDAESVDTESKVSAIVANETPLSKAEQDPIDAALQVVRQATGKAGE